MILFLIICYFKSCTIVNGCCSCSSKVTLSVPQGSVLRPFLFSLCCNDLPDIVSDCDGELHMYADDTTMYLIDLILTW